MIRIEIIAFRSHVNKILEIDTGLTLLKGISGSGKSTIFQAFYWTLYGKLNNTYSLKDDDNKKKKCEVIVKDGNIIIRRKKNPSLLKVNYKNEEYIDQSAQEIIDKIYGNKSIWLSTSYIIQGER